MTLQQCGVIESRGVGHTKIRKLAGNNTLLTVDKFLVHRVYSLTTYQVIEEIDLKPFFSQTGIMETMVDGGYFNSDTEIHMIIQDKFYR